jgi:hypothetical protein
MKRTLSTVLALMFLMACVGPRKFVERPEGSVWGWSRESAERVAEALPVAERVRQRLGSTREGGVVIHVLAHQDPSDNSYGGCSDVRISLNPSALSNIEFALAHECAHWYAVGSPFDGMPLWMEEGLADWISCEVVGALEFRRLEIQGIGKFRTNSTLFLAGRTRWQTMSVDEIRTLTFLGFMVVDTIGLEEVARLARERSETNDYLRAARLEPVTFETSTTDSARNDTR